MVTIIFQVLLTIATLYLVYITIHECIELWKEINK